MIKQENTLKNYESTINCLKKLTGSSDLIKEFKKPSGLIKLINDNYTNINTKRAYLSRIIALIKENPQWAVSKGCEKKFRDVFNSLSKDLIDQTDENQLTQKEKAVYLPFNEVMELRNLLEEKMKMKPSFKLARDYLIVSLYTLNPPVRLDYTPMKVIQRYNKNLNDKINYLVLGKNPKFVFNKYKTKKFYGVNEVPISKYLMGIINDWFKFFNPEKKWLIVQDDGKTPMTQNDLSKRIKQIFKKYTGKPATISTLRHSFISTMINNMTNLKTRKKIAKQMGHSVLQQLQYNKIL